MTTFKLIVVLFGLLIIPATHPLIRRTEQSTHPLVTRTEQFSNPLPQLLSQAREASERMQARNQATIENDLRTRVAEHEELALKVQDRPNFENRSRLLESSQALENLVLKQTLSPKERHAPQDEQISLQISLQHRLLDEKHAREKANLAREQANLAREHNLARPVVNTPLRPQPNFFTRLKNSWYQLFNRPR